MMIRSLFLLVFGACVPLFAADPSSDDQLETLDKQIQALSLQIDSYRHQILRAEADAQNGMKSNFPLYVEKVKESEKYEVLSRNAEKQLKILMDERDNLIKSQSSQGPSTQKSK